MPDVSVEKWALLLDAGEYGIAVNGTRLMKFVPGEGTIEYDFPLGEVILALGQTPIEIREERIVENVKVEITLEMIEEIYLVCVIVASDVQGVQPCVFGWTYETLKANLKRAQSELNHTEEDE